MTFGKSIASYAKNKYLNVVITPTQHHPSFFFKKWTAVYIGISLHTVKWKSQIKIALLLCDRVLGDVSVLGPLWAESVIVFILVAVQPDSGAQRSLFLRHRPALL